MELERLYMISEIPGYSPQIGQLVSMMNFTRWTTLEAIKGLNAKQLDYVHDEQSNSIGALLRHIASVEYFYYVETLEERQMNESEMTEWAIAFHLGKEANDHFKGYTLDEHIAYMNEVRQKTLNALKNKTDDWLFEYQTYAYLQNKPMNNYFKWFHVFEDELNHRGQIRWLRKRLPADLE